MPARQAGSYYRVSGGWGVRWYESGGRRYQSGFESKSAARDYFGKVVKPRLDGVPSAPDPLTLSEFTEKFIARYEAIRAPATVRSLRWRMVRPLREFGDVALDEIRTAEVASWEASLPPRFRHDVMRAFRMVGKAAVDWGYLQTNPIATGPNPAPAVIERGVLTPVEVDTLAQEMEPPYGAAVLVGAWCFLRPSELLSLERRDVDLDAGLLHVRGTKTARSRRSVPVPLRARQALEALPARIDTRLLFPAAQGGVYRLDNFRPGEFDWAVASGLSWALAAGIPAVDVARYGGRAAGVDDAVRPPAHLPLIALPLLRPLRQP